MSFWGARGGTLRLLAVNAVLLVLLFGALFAGFEIYCRYFDDTTDSFSLTRASVRWFKRYYHTNAAGFRDTFDYPLKKQPGIKRITFIGDSFTAGHGIKNPDDRFANLIRKKLGAEWEVHVLAQNGWDLGQEINLLHEAIGKGYELDQVILVYTLNDISDIVPEWQEIVKRIYADTDHLPFWVRHSYFMNSLYFRWRARKNPDISNYYHFVQKAYEGDLWEKQKNRLKNFTEEVTAHGGKSFVVIFPFLHPMPKGYEYASVHKNLGQFLREINVPYLDLLTVYKDFLPWNLTVNRHDAHPNEWAHRLAAEKILPFLESASHAA